MNQKKRWLVSAALLGGFLSCYFLDFTGVSLHQWLGLAIGALAGCHLLTHWAWVRAISARFFGATSSQARGYFLLDAAIAAGFSVMILTGLVISTWLNLSLANYAAWRSLHILASAATLLATTLKIALHARMILTTLRKFAGNRPAPTSPDLERRGLVRLMGVVGAASFIALGSSVTSLAESGDAAGAEADTAAGAAAGAGAGVETDTAAGPQLWGLSASSSSACSVQCRRRCAYPGHCRRYVDSNGSGRCDLGECLS